MRGAKNDRGVHEVSEVSNEVSGTQEPAPGCQAVKHRMVDGRAAEPSLGGMANLLSGKSFPINIINSVTLGTPDTVDELLQDPPPRPLHQETTSEVLPTPSPTKNTRIPGECEHPGPNGGMDGSWTKPTVQTEVRTQVEDGHPTPDSTTAEGKAVVKGGSRVVEAKETKGSVSGRVKCVYRRGGICVEHREGARKHFRPVITRERGSGGEEVIKKSRKMFYVYDLDLTGRRRMTQPRLSFGSTPDRSSGTRDTKQEISNFSDASKVGQTPSKQGDVRTEEVDEN